MSYATRWALHYLSGKKVSLNETAYLVRFSEPAAFSRASSVGPVQPAYVGLALCIVSPTRWSVAAAITFAVC